MPLKFGPKLARLLFGTGIAMVTWATMVGGIEQRIFSIVSGLLIGIGASMNWGEDDE